MPEDRPTRDEINRPAASRRAFWWLTITLLVVVSAGWEGLLFAILHHPPAVLGFLPFAVAVAPFVGILSVTTVPLMPWGLSVAMRAARRPD
ncbi:MAG: hypothetical protein ACR2MY_12920 [Candidatus Dormibacteria bacterium]